MSATVLPAATDMTGVSVTEGQFKTAITAQHDFISELQTKASDVTAASTTAIGAAQGNYVKIVGSTTIAAFDNPVQAPNVTRICLFAAALTLTHNGTSLILPRAANITTAANDIAVFVHEGSGNWRCVSYQPAAGYSPIAGPGSSVPFATGELDPSGQIKFTAVTGMTTPSYGNVGIHSTYGLSVAGIGSANDFTIFNKSLSVAAYVATGSTTLSTSSDENMKENLTPITDAAAKVASMRHVMGNLKAEFDPEKRTQPFLIAQDVYAVLPEAVDSTNEGHWGVSYQSVMPLHGAAIAELLAQNTALEARLAALEAKLI